jgi:hypothetical protein
MKSFDKVFLTGCDNKTEWMLGWFLKHYYKHNTTPIIFANFGVGEQGLDQVSSCAHIINMQDADGTGWFKKPQAMIEASKISNKVCWIDTDCHVLSDLSGVFDLIEPNKLAMVEDIPWSKRRQEVWHNTGVVAFQDRPPILDQWFKAVKANPVQGDQEVLHTILRKDLKRQINTTSLPQEYNWLRLLLQDGVDSKKKKVMHWTGAKGKEYIKGIVND